MEDFLYSFGIDKSKVGYPLLLECFDLMNNDKVLTLHIFRVYDALAKKYSTIPQKIERSLDSLFKKTFVPEMPTRKQVLFLFNEAKKNNLL